MKRKKIFDPGRIGSYFRAEWLPLTFVTLTGLVYNVGLLATPWFEGRLAQCLADRTEYGMNPDKTEGGALISAFACEPETAVSEFALSKREYRELTGQEMEKFYRPPQGVYSEENLRMAKELGYKTVFWSLAYVDWYQDDQPTAEQAFSKLIPRIHPGAVVLLHSTSQTNAAILDELIGKWEALGYRFGRLEELFD